MKFMAKLCGLDVKRVRAAMRGLKELGLADYGTCWDEHEGRPCGSGYSLTWEGYEVQRKLSPKVGAEELRLSAMQRVWPMAGNEA